MVAPIAGTSAKRAAFRLPAAPEAELARCDPIHPAGLFVCRQADYCRGHTGSHEVRLGESHIARQKDTVAELERDGYVDASRTARDLVATFVTTQRSHVEDRNRLRAELAALS